MGIYRKKVVEKSEAIFAIRADTQKQADAAFNKFFDMQNRSYEDYREHMNETMRDDISNLKYYCSDSEYEKSGEHHDIFIDAYEQAEPLYDLYLLEGATFKEGHLKIYEDIDLNRVIEVANEHNKTYILDPRIGIPYEYWIKSLDKGTRAIAYRLTKREEQANG